MGVDEPQSCITPFFYRFRSLDALLGNRQELEKQEIYFSPPEQLNDPMEGYKDFVWQGDEIVWRNLVRHYLLCLMQTISIAIIFGKDFRSAIPRGVPFPTASSLPTAALKATHQSICKSFFSSREINGLPALLAARSHAVRRDELEFCLRAIHPLALNSVVKVFSKEKKLAPAGAPLPGAILAKTIINNLSKVLTATGDNGGNTEALRHMFAAAGHIHKQVDLINYLGETNELARDWHFIFYSFPEWYVENLQNLVHFDWYAACFVADPTHAAMWGSYGDGHKGVCLKFRANDTTGTAPVLQLRGIKGSGGGPHNGPGPIHGDIALPFEKMTYADKLVEIDFFRSLGRLSGSALNAEWYTDDENKVSSCAESMVAQTADDWRQRYWASFRAMATTKMQDWQHEEEYRLVLTSVLGSYVDAKDRKLTYRFSDLEGIIFGIRTPADDKARIINCVADKCKAEGRKSFEFSQATYAAHNGKIENRRLDLLRFE